MIAESNGGSEIKFCELIEHPAGHDGGEFPHYESFSAEADGSLHYRTDFPSCSNDTFADEDLSDYTSVTNREQALRMLISELAEAKQHVQTLTALVQAFTKPEPFYVHSPYEDYEEDHEKHEKFLVSIGAEDCNILDHLEDEDDTDDEWPGLDPVDDERCK